MMYGLCSDCIKKGDRDGVVDAIKGILILCVVVGHMYPFFGHYANWFHMPLFFVIAGFFTKDNGRFIQTICNKAKRLLIPYLSYFVVFRIVMGAFVSGEFNFDAKEFFCLTIWGSGGKTMTGIYGVWWFPTCLFAAYLLFYLLSKTGRFCFVIAMCLSVASYILSLLMIENGLRHALNHSFPWSMNIALIAVMYMYIGNVLYKYRERFRFDIRYLIISMVIILFYVLLDYFGIIVNDIAMKESLYGSDFIFLFTFPIVVLYFLRCVVPMIPPAIRNLVGIIGKNSMYTMYVHLPIMYCVRGRLSNGFCADILIILLSVFVGHVLGRISKSNKYLSIIVG